MTVAHLYDVEASGPLCGAEVGRLVWFADSVTCPDCRVELAADRTDGHPPAR